MRENAPRGRGNVRAAFFCGREWEKEGFDDLGGKNGNVFHIWTEALRKGRAIVRMFNAWLRTGGVGGGASFLKRDEKMPAEIPPAA